MIMSSNVSWKVIILLSILSCVYYYHFVVNKYGNTQLKNAQFTSTSISPTQAPLIAPTQLSSLAPSNDVVEKLDIVYLWVNTTKTDMILRETAAIEFVQKQLNSSNYNKNDLINYGELPDPGWCPTVDRGELGLSLRSLYKYGNNVINNIYIVTDGGNFPYWLNMNNSRITVVDANKLVIECQQYYLQRMSLDKQINIHHLRQYGSFNTHAKYLCLHRIYNLSTIFISSDDDMLLKSVIHLNDLYNIDENDGINTIKHSYRKELITETQIANILCSDLDYKIEWETHQWRVYNKTRINNLWNTFPIQLLNTVNHMFRSTTDIVLPSFYPIWQYCKYNISFNYIANTKSIKTHTIVINQHRSISENIKKINRYNSNKYMLLQDGTQKWNKSYDSINVRKLFIFFPKLLNLTKPSPFEHCQNQNFFKTKIMAPYLNLHANNSSNYIKLEINRTKKDEIIIVNTKKQQLLSDILLLAKQYMDGGKKDIYFEIELKGKGINDRLVFNLVNVLKTVQYPLNRLIISSFEAPPLASVKKLLNESGTSRSIRLALIAAAGETQINQSYASNLVKSALNWNLTHISVLNKVISQQFVYECEINNINTQIEMVKNETTDTIFEALLYNPNVLYTNKPILAKQIIHSITSQCMLFNMHNI